MVRPILAAVDDIADRARVNPWLWRVPIIIGLALIGVVWTLVWAALL